MENSVEPISEIAEASPSQVANLLEHLARIGVSFVPKSDVTPQIAAASGGAVVAAGTSSGPVGTVASVHAASPPVAAATTQARKPGIGNESAAKALPRPSTPVARTPVYPAATDRPDLLMLDQPYPGDPMPVGQRIERLAELASQVSQCRLCETLAGSRRTTVFGEGAADARVCFFGEAPGEEEDATGRPFVGRSGLLLTKMIEACTFSRDQVYILNTVKCRPPGNRNPEPTELANCRPFFEEQLRIIRPDYIVCLGLVAAQTLMATTLSIGRLRGRFYRYHSSKVLATYHPSYLLRNPSAKKEAWADLQLLMADMGIAPNKR
jgi:uracil-DNA glycosylase